MHNGSLSVGDCGLIAAISIMHVVCIALTRTMCDGLWPSPPVA